MHREGLRDFLFMVARSPQKLDLHVMKQRKIWEEHDNSASTAMESEKSRKNPKPKREIVSL